MKTTTAAGILLVLLLSGCSMPSSDMSSARRDQANYHADNFGEPDNTPFQGVYPGH